MFRLFLLYICQWLWCLSSLLIKPRMLTYDKGFQREVRCRKIDSHKYESWKKEAFRIVSDYGCILSCELIEPPDNIAQDQEIKVAVLCHGLGMAKYESIKYAEIFIMLGFTVVMYDHRNHGKSDKCFTTMGYFEKYDLKKVIDWCYDRFGKKCKIITHGESMGAATVLLHLEIDKRVSCVIADCAYSDLGVLLRHQLKEYYHLPRFLIPIESSIAYIRAGFLFKEVSPIKITSRTNTPILFIHGKRDNFVPTYMSKIMYTCKKKNKAIYLVSKAKHAESCCVNREGYQKRVEEFLSKYMK